ncbi:hypothetical protein PHMEG_00028110 [Phytophthora megakarya]|uniref:Uncharacterized protein n=1 Tax=Phytophthora megakarya TaxID=4795 RepID=A0A225V6B8_9STRA|nr:hypothetical protein PHMEG_00028110 [Phytophthora megakarya]
MAWLTDPSNVSQWRRDKNASCREICQVLATNGIHNREMGDVQLKLRFMHNQFANATAHLYQKKEMAAFQRGDADSEVVDEVLKMCPQYRELLPCFGANIATKEIQGTSKSAADGTANNAGGEWKKNLEKDIHAHVTEEKQVRGEKSEKSGSNGVASTKQTGSKAEQKMAKENDAEVENGQHLVARTKDTAKRNTDAEAETGKKDKNDEVGQHDASENDADEGKQSSDEEEAADTVVDQADAQDSTESEDESSEEEVKPPISRAGLRSPFKTKSRQIKSEESSSEEEDSSEEKGDSESESEVEEGGSGEERIPLAQLDEVDEATPEVEDEEQVEHTQVDEAANDEGTNDDGEREKDESDETEEEAEEEPEHNLKGAANSSGDSDNNSSESDGEDAENDEEVPPTQVKAPSDLEEESEDEVGNDGDESKPELAGDTQNQSDPDVEMAVEEPSEVGSESPPIEQATRKRSTSKDSSSPTTKRSRREHVSNEATRDLERKAFIERAKQERSQRDELFKLERAKLECELQAKQVQLAMERSLARKTLLDAGIDLKEVDRILPL